MRTSALALALTLAACGTGMASYVGGDSVKNVKPVANAGPDQTAASAAAVTLDGSGSSIASGAPLSYGWTQTAGPSVSLAAPASAVTTFAAPTVSASTPLTFLLTVTSGTQASSDAIVVTVRAPG